MSIPLERLRTENLRYYHLAGADGKTRHFLPILMAWIADLEEQLLITGVRPGSCPLCLASGNDLGKPGCCGVRTGEWTLDQLRKIRNEPQNLTASTWQFSEKVKAAGLGLNGCTEQPCWIGLPLGPEKFIKNDLLHGTHKFIWDHPRVWLAHTLGEEELDKRYGIQPKIDSRVLEAGLSILSQVAGTEHRVAQMYMLPVTLGHPQSFPPVVNAIRSILDFSYISQYPAISELDLDEMRHNLEVYHNNKYIFIANGARGDMDHINVPKAHSLPHTPQDIPNSGVPTNFTTDTPESLHKGQKEGFDHSNKRTEQFMQQIINYDIVKDKVAFRRVFVEWEAQRSQSFVNPMTHCGYMVRSRRTIMFLISSTN